MFAFLLYYVKIIVVNNIDTPALYKGRQVIFMFSKNMTPIAVLESITDDMASRIADFVKHSGDFTRRRKLDASTFIKVTFNMAGQSLNTELINAFPDPDDRMTESAYEQAKDKVKPELFKELFRAFNKTLKQHRLLNDKYMVFAIDGSDFNPPYQSKSKFAVTTQNGRPKKDGTPIKPFSQLHANILFNIMDWVYEDVVIQPKMSSNERDAAITMLKNLNPGKPYIVLMDRGYDGFNMIEHCNRLNGKGYYIIRTKAGKGGIREIEALPDKEYDREMDFYVTTSGQYYNQHKDEEDIHLVTHHEHQYKKYLSPNTRNQRWDFKQFEHVKCRVVKFRINDADTGKEEWEVLVTNLNRFEFPIKKMKELYHLRWGQETSFKELKYALTAVQFHSRKDDFVEMELLAHLTMFNAVSRTINRVSVPQSEKKKYRYVISFKDAATIVRKYFRLFCKDPPDRIFTELLSYTRPVQSGLADKRNMKPKSAVWFVYRVA